MQRREADGFLLRWKWVLLYSLFLLASMAVAPYAVSGLCCTEWIGPLTWGPGFLVAGGLAWLGIRFLRSGHGGKGIWLAAFLFVSLGYGLFLYRLSTYPVERFHLLEYGILAFLWIRALDVRTGWARRSCYALAGVLLVGFLDEVLQGVLPRRYYENRDILLNATSGVFGLVSYYLYSGFRGPRLSDRAPGGGAVAPRKKDVACFALVAGIAAGMFILETLPVGPGDLFGVWERPGGRGRVERMQLCPPDRFSWSDNRGNRSLGRFRLAGNRLESVILEFAVEIDENRSRRGVRRKGAGGTFTKRIRKDGEAIYFAGEEAHPWRRIGIQCP